MLENKDKIVLDQVRTIDKKRIIEIQGKISSDKIKKVKATLKELFVD